jgi:undecaprenyl diphosphate synthase
MQNMSQGMNIPQHIAIIMDGNGRWAEKQGKPRAFGHTAGVESLRKITAECTRLGVKYLTVYAFSTENWNRPPEEVRLLMELVISSLDYSLFDDNNVRFRTIGDRERLPQNVQNAVADLEEHTKDHSRMTVTVALSYSSRWELTDCMQKIAAKVEAGELKAKDITEQTIIENLNSGFQPDPDLLIRTGGDIRISNYMLWQIAYSELYFTSVYWPDFREQELIKAIEYFNTKQRRFGLTEAQVEQGL